MLPQTGFLMHAVQLGILVKQDEIAEDRARSTQYVELLKVNGTKLPNPLLHLTEGWLKEKDAVEQIMTGCGAGWLHGHRQTAVRGPMRQRTKRQQLKDGSKDSNTARSSPQRLQRGESLLVL
ncbi:hypothetical protein Bbelb_216050 [Branchiostoma belcheri]|nr:hypothetical protein Bbelb_216050 [Branchiostoma belcheri]